MALAPDATAETVPGYVSDGAGNWFRIDPGEHAHPEHLPLAGGTIAPGPLNVPAPTAPNHAARLVDGMPRFANAAERDAAYAALPGGVQVGMNCFVLDRKERQVWSGTKWKISAMAGGGSHIRARLDAPAYWAANITPIPFNSLMTPARGTDLSFTGGWIQILTDGFYRFGGFMSIGNLVFGQDHSTFCGLYSGGALIDSAFVNGGGAIVGTFYSSGAAHSCYLTAGIEIRACLYAMANYDGNLHMRTGSYMWAMRVG